MELCFIQKKYEPTQFNIRKRYLRRVCRLTESSSFAFAHLRRMSLKIINTLKNRIKIFYSSHSNLGLQSLFNDDCSKKYKKKTQPGYEVARSGTNLH